MHIIYNYYISIAQLVWWKSTATDAKNFQILLSWKSIKTNVDQLEYYFLEISYYSYKSFEIIAYYFQYFFHGIIYNCCKSITIISNHFQLLLCLKWINYCKSIAIVFSEKLIITVYQVYCFFDENQLYCYFDGNQMQLLQNFCTYFFIIN